MMKRRIFSVLIFGLVGALAFGCAGPKPQPMEVTFDAQDLNPMVQSGRFESKVDNFVLIMDTSQSLEEDYQGQPKFEITKNVVSHLNQTIPELDINSGLRTFGHSRAVSKDITDLMYGMVPYSTEGFESGIEKVAKAGGTSPLGAAIAAAGEDLKTTMGKTALIIVSDGKEMGKKPLEAAEKLKMQMGGDICYYTILVGNDPEGEALLQNIAEVGECGFAMNADALATGPAVADFVEKVFLAEAVMVAAPMDSDGDGVPDDLDRCPDTPRGVEVDQYGCPLDSDGDGVPDYLDQCPGTPQGVRVNSVGCWIVGVPLFDFDKFEIKPEYYPVLDEVVRAMMENPGMTVEIQGHTDGIGTEAYNQILSEKRANAVKAYLVDKGIDPDRLTALGFGKTRPIAPNDTAEGRAQNRRVQLNPTKQ
jgi:OOP family OmpA-OmpF porin